MGEVRLNLMSMADEMVVDQHSSEKQLGVVRKIGPENFTWSPHRLTKAVETGGGLNPGGKGSTEDGSTETHP